MKKLLGLLGLVAACGVCCAFPLALPALGALAASGLGVAFGWQAAALSGMAVALALGLFVRRRQARAAACTPAVGSHCSAGCTAGKSAG